MMMNTSCRRGHVLHNRCCCSGLFGCSLPTPTPTPPTPDMSGCMMFSKLNPQDQSASWLHNAKAVQLCICPPTGLEYFCLMYAAAALLQQSSMPCLASDKVLTSICPTCCMMHAGSALLARVGSRCAYAASSNMLAVDCCKSLDQLAVKPSCLSPTAPVTVCIIHLRPTDQNLSCQEVLQDQVTAKQAVMKKMAVVVTMRWRRGKERVSVSGWSRRYGRLHMACRLKLKSHAMMYDSREPSASMLSLHTCCKNL